MPFFFELILLPYLIPRSRKKKLFALLASRKSSHEVAAETGVHYQTVLNYRRSVGRGKCRCGRPVGHLEFCVSIPKNTRPKVIAEVSTANGFRRKVRCTINPTPREANLLFALCEHACRPISLDDLCYRLKWGKPSVTYVACMLRKKLTDEWAILSTPRVGMRIVYMPDELVGAERTHIKLDRRFEVYNASNLVGTGRKKENV